LAKWSKSFDLSVPTIEDPSGPSLRCEFEISDMHLFDNYEIQKIGKNFYVICGSTAHTTYPRRKVGLFQILDMCSVKSSTTTADPRECSVVLKTTCLFVDSQHHYATNSRNVESLHEWCSIRMPYKGFRIVHHSFNIQPNHK